jgi:exopolysaccharide production protein ExoZ
MRRRHSARRRIRRILPIYFMACVPTIPMAMRAGFGWRDALMTFLLWPATDVMTKPFLGVSWTLSFEMLFYASTALVLYNRRWLYVLGAGYAVAFSLRLFGYPVFQFVGNPLVLEFLFGVALIKAPNISSRLGLTLAAFGFVALAGTGYIQIEPRGDAMDFLNGTASLHRVIVYGLPSGLVVYGFMQIKAGKSIWTYLGNASYSIYLFHTYPLMFLLAVWQAFPIAPDLIVLIGVGVALLLSIAIHATLEMPILRAIPTAPLVLGRPARRIP